MSDQIVFQEPIEEYPVYVSFQSADTRIGIIKRNNQKKFAYFPEKLVELKESDLEAILSKVRKLNAPRIAYRGLNDADARIAELEGKIDQLTAHDATERQDDKLPEREVCEACGGDGSILLRDNYKGQATATVDCPYCNCTGYVKECE